jgi:hypothetical protein
MKYVEISISQQMYIFVMLNLIEENENNLIQTNLGIIFS